MLSGPVDQDGRRILLIVEAARIVNLRSRLHQDPSSQAGLLPLTSVAQWQVLQTGKRMSG